MQEPFKKLFALSSSGSASHYVVIGIGSETFGVAANQIREIICLGDLVPRPRLPNGFTGPMRLTGQMIFLVKLQAAFARHQAESEITARTCILVLKGRSAISPKVPKGVVVDRVERIIELEERDIEIVQTRRKGLWSTCTLGFGRRHLPIFLFDLDVLASAESTETGRTRSDTSETVVVRSRRRDA
jgi:chemotaxis signal transduction protein